ncbi:MAG: tripartite tricarboxylate transporter permease, partial [Succinivibrio dextrinosolvens]|nr:tripartite tricarboxylate transporter permease [Succinivibrio dextrinosolvens]
MDSIIQAFGILVTFENLGLLAIGTAVGIFVGAMPGLSVNMGLALLFPITFSVGGWHGIIMLLGIYCGAIYGGSITAILLKTPGTPASAATTLDGYPMARGGQPGRALAISTTASTFGGIFSTVCLVLFAPMLAKIALQFSKPEYFALAIFGISMITSVAPGSILKGIIGCLVGLWIATIGLDPMSGMERFTFGTLYLSGGISFMPILIGLFALTQVFINAEEMYHRSTST